MLERERGRESESKCHKYKIMYLVTVRDENEIIRMMNFRDNRRKKERSRKK